MIKFFDAFGKPVSLNFRGQEKYKTIPGALFTAFTIWMIVNYAIFRSDYYKNIPLTWKVSEHNTLVKGSDLNPYIDITNQNLSLKLEIHSNAL